MPTRSPATAGGRGDTVASQPVVMPRPVDLTNYDIRATAFDAHHTTGTLEIDRYNDVLRREEGAWVKALVWVDYDDVRDARKADGFHDAGRWDDVEQKYQPKNYKRLLNPKDPETKNGNSREPDVSET